MIVLLALVLLVPLVGAVATVARRGPDLLAPVSALAAAGWISLAVAASGSAVDPTRSTTHSTVDLGQLHVTSAAAAAFAGLALLVPIGAPSNGVLGSVALTSISLAAVTATSGSSSPDGRFAIGVLVVGLVAASGLRSRPLGGRLRAAGPAAVTIASMLLALGLTLNDPAHASAAVAVGAFAAIAAVLVTGRSSALFLVPVALLAVVRVPPPVPTSSTTWTSVPVVVAGAIAVVSALALFASRRAELNLRAGAAFAVVAVLGGLVGAPTWQPVVLLFSVAAVAALTTMQRVALIAALPAVAALVDAASAATGQAEAVGAIGASVVLAALALVGPHELPARFDWPLPTIVGSRARYDAGVVVLSVVFGLSSAWSWARAGLGGFTEATATALAVGAIVLSLSASRSVPSDQRPSVVVSRFLTGSPRPATERTPSDGSDGEVDAEVGGGVEVDATEPAPATRRPFGRFTASRTRLVDGSDG